MVEKDKKLVPYKIVKASNTATPGSGSRRPDLFTFAGLRFPSCEDEKRAAEAHLGQKVEQAVITVSAYFNDAQRQATTRTPARSPGEVRIINEPTAAAPLYGLDKTKTGTIAVYDLSSGTFGNVRPRNRRWRVPR